MSKMEKKSSKNFPICRPKPSKSESKRGQNREKIVQKFHILNVKTIKKSGFKKCQNSKKFPICRSKPPKKLAKIVKKAKPWKFYRSPELFLFSL